MNVNKAKAVSVAVEIMDILIKHNLSLSDVEFIFPHIIDEIKSHQPVTINCMEKYVSLS